MVLGVDAGVAGGVAGTGGLGGGGFSIIKSVY